MVLNLEFTEWFETTLCLCMFNFRPLSDWRLPMPAMPLRDIKKFLEWILSLLCIILPLPRSARCWLLLLLFIDLVLKLFKFIELAAPGD